MFNTVTGPLPHSSYAYQMYSSYFNRIIHWCVDIHICSWVSHNNERTYEKKMITLFSLFLDYRLEILWENLNIFWQIRENSPIFSKKIIFPETIHTIHTISKLRYSVTLSNVWKRLIFETVETAEVFYYTAVFCSKKHQ